MAWFSHYEKLKMIETIIDTQPSDEDNYDLLEKIQLILQLDCTDSPTTQKEGKDDDS